MVRCGQCGLATIKQKNAIGRGFPYKKHKKVVLTVDIDLWTCLACGNILLTHGDCKRLDEAIRLTLYGRKDQMKYTVTIEERMTKDVFVEADSPEEAEQKAMEGEYVLKEEINIDTVLATVHGE